MAVSGFVTRGKTAATRTTILKIDRLLETRIEAFDRYIEISDKRSGYFQPPEYVIYDNDSSVNSDWDRFVGQDAFLNNADPNYAVFLARKRFKRAHFPQRITDWDFDFPKNGPDGPFAGMSSNPNDSTESAEMLYHLLNNGVLFGAPPVGEGEFNASEVADTDDDGFPEYVDGWGRPIRFYLWPTRIIRPVFPPDIGIGNFRPSDPQTAVDPPGDVFINPEAPANSNNPNHNFIWFLMNTLPDSTMIRVDPDDILGINVDPNPSGKPNATSFENQFHTMNTWHRPLIMSAGEDGSLGLFEPNDTANKGYLAQPDFAASNWYADIQDNISNWYLRPGGR